jgi:hypothetical protein
MAKEFKTFEEFEKQRSADFDAMHGKLIEAYEVMMESDTLSFADFIGDVEGFKWCKFFDAERMAKLNAMIDLFGSVAEDCEDDGDSDE